MLVESLIALDLSFMFIFRVTVLSTPVIVMRFCFFAVGKFVSYHMMNMD